MNKDFVLRFLLPAIYDEVNECRNDAAKEALARLAYAFEHGIDWCQYETEQLDADEHKELR